jgi:acetoin utilization deacetylase AcuC-like enzyme
VEPDVSAEGPAAKRRIRNLLDVSGLLARLTEIPGRTAELTELEAVHTPAYLRRLADLSAGQGGDAGEVAPFTHGSFELARLAVGGCIDAARAVQDGRLDCAYALVRPPGHHAEADRGRGFCLLANTALTVHACLRAGAERIAMIDWDVHHGNGTQAAFWDDPRVLTVSIHQDRNFPPDSGLAEERGGPHALGTNLNVPLPAGSGGGAYLAAFDRLILPAVEQFGPELIVVASGVDACALDTYGRMLLTSESFRAMARRTREAADELCEGRLVAVHEGGYSTAYAPFCTLAIIEEFVDERTEVEDPFLEELESGAGQQLQPHQEEAIERIAATLSSGYSPSGSPG